MYYSKNNSPRITVPRNYSGNMFRSEEDVLKPYIEERKAPAPEPLKCESDAHPDSKLPSPPLFSALTGISVEDLLLLGVIFVVLSKDPSDDIVLLFLLLLLVK